MASKQVIGKYQGQPIYAGTDAEVSAQMAAIDAGRSAPVQTIPQTQAELDKMYSDATVSNPTVASIVGKGNSVDAVNYAAMTGDFSGLVGATGQPFSAQDQADALAQATAAVSPYYEAEKTFETANTEAILKQKQLDYQNYLDNQAQKFQDEKATQDQTAADRGVLFSGGRVQKLQQLGENYNKADEYKKATVGADIANTARDFGYKYGTPAAQNLSQYYSLGGNTYNPHVATGGVGNSGLSSIYNAGSTNFQGTQINAAKAAAQTRAAELLANKANKIVPYGYKNQF